MIADLITISRMICSSLMLLLPPFSASFSVLYLLCGASDVLDGFAARKLHTESDKGAVLDSAADLFFAVVYVVKILPPLTFPLWIWIWTAIIAVTKTICILIASKKAHRLQIEHSFGNKITGVLLFFLPASVYFNGLKYAASLACMAATLSAFKEAKQNLMHIR